MRLKMLLRVALIAVAFAALGRAYLDRDVCTQRKSDCKSISHNLTLINLLEWYGVIPDDGLIK